MCLGLDVTGNVLVWGTSKEGLLGLGYDITSIEIPTKLECLHEIVDVSLSDNHAVAISSLGEPFSWGTGKYGELGLDKSIYTPTPLRMSTDKLYTKAFCGNLITCLLDSNGKFSYYGVIIKMLKGSNSSITVKSLLNDEINSDPKFLFQEKVIVELENESFISIIIGNGFIGLLSKKGTVFALEYSDKLTMLYSKHFVYSIAVAYNDIYGLSIEKEYSSKTTGSLLKKSSSISNSNKEKNYFLCKWNSKCLEKEVSSEIWHTTIYKISEDVHMQNLSLLNTNGNRNLLLLMEKDFTSTNLNSSFLASNNRKSIDSNDISWDNITYSELPSNISRKGYSIDNFLIFDSEFDDSYNMKFKRSKSQNKTYNGNTNRSFSPYLNRTMIPFQTGTNISTINPNNYQKSTMNMSCVMGKSMNDIRGSITKGSALQNSIDGNVNTGGDNVNYYDESIDLKEKELQNYRKEVYDILRDFRNKQKESRTTLRNKYSSMTHNSSRFSRSNTDLLATAKPSHYRVQSSDLGLSFSAEVRRLNNLNTTPGNKKRNLDSLENKSVADYEYSNNKNESDLDGFLNKTNNMDGSNIKNEILSDDEFNKTDNSGVMFAEVSQIKQTGKGQFFSPGGSKIINYNMRYNTTKGTPIVTSKDDKNILGNLGDDQRCHTEENYMLKGKHNLSGFAPEENFRGRSNSSRYSKILSLVQSRNLVGSEIKETEEERTKSAKKQRVLSSRNRDDLINEDLGYKDTPQFEKQGTEGKNKIGSFNANYSSSQHKGYGTTEENNEVTPINMEGEDQRFTLSGNNNRDPRIQQALLQVEIGQNLAEGSNKDGSRNLTEGSQKVTEGNNKEGSHKNTEDSYKEGSHKVTEGSHRITSGSEDKKSMRASHRFHSEDGQEKSPNRRNILNHQKKSKVYNISHKSKENDISQEEAREEQNKSSNRHFSSREMGFNSLANEDNISGITINNGNSNSSNSNTGNMINHLQSQNRKKKNEFNGDVQIRIRKKPEEGDDIQDSQQKDSYEESSAHESVKGKKNKLNEFADIPMGYSQQTGKNKTKIKKNVNAKEENQNENENESGSANPSKKNSNRKQFVYISDGGLQSSDISEKKYKNNNQLYKSNFDLASDSDGGANSPTFRNAKGPIKYNENELFDFPNLIKKSKNNSGEKGQNSFQQSSEMGQGSLKQSIETKSEQNNEIKHGRNNHPKHSNDLIGSAKQNISIGTENSVGSGETDLVFSFDPNAMQKKLMQNKLKEQLNGTNTTNGSKINHISQKEIGPIQEVDEKKKKVIRGYSEDEESEDESPKIKKRSKRKDEGVSEEEDESNGTTKKIKIQKKAKKENPQEESEESNEEAYENQSKVPKPKKKKKYKGSGENNEEQEEEEQEEDEDYEKEKPQKKSKQGTTSKQYRSKRGELDGLNNDDEYQFQTDSSIKKEKNEITKEGGKNRRGKSKSKGDIYSYTEKDIDYIKSHKRKSKSNAGDIKKMLTQSNETESEKDGNQRPLIGNKKGKKSINALDDSNEEYEDEITHKKSKKAPSEVTRKEEYYDTVGKIQKKIHERRKSKGGINKEESLDVRLNTSQRSKQSGDLNNSKTENVYFKGDKMVSKNAQNILLQKYEKSASSLQNDSEENDYEYSQSRTVKKKKIPSGSKKTKTGQDIQNAPSEPEETVEEHFVVDPITGEKKLFKTVTQKVIENVPENGEASQEEEVLEEKVVTDPVSKEKKIIRKLKKKYHTDNQTGPEKQAEELVEEEYVIDPVSQEKKLVKKTKKRGQKNITGNNQSEHEEEIVEQHIIDPYTKEEKVIQTITKKGDTIQPNDTQPQEIVQYKYATNPKTKEKELIKAVTTKINSNQNQKIFGDSKEKDDEIVEEHYIIDPKTNEKRLVKAMQKIIKPGQKGYKESRNEETTEEQYIIDPVTKEQKILQIVRRAAAHDQRIGQNNKGIYLVQEKYIVDPETQEKSVVRTIRKKLTKGERGEDEESGEEIIKEHYAVDPITKEKNLVQATKTTVTPTRQETISEEYFVDPVTGENKVNQTVKKKVHSAVIKGEESGDEKEEIIQNQYVVDQGTKERRLVKTLKTEVNSSTTSKEERGKPVIEEKLVTDPVTKEKKIIRTIRETLASENPRIKKEEVTEEEYKIDPLTKEKHLVNVAKKKVETRLTEGGKIKEVVEEKYVSDPKTKEKMLLKSTKKVLSQPKEDKKGNSVQEITEELYSINPETNEKNLIKTTKRKVNQKELLHYDQEEPNSDEEHIFNPVTQEKTIVKKFKSSKGGLDEASKDNIVVEEQLIVDPNTNGKKLIRTIKRVNKVPGSSGTKEEVLETQEYAIDPFSKEKILVKKTQGVPQKESAPEGQGIQEIEEEYSVDPTTGNQKVVRRLKNKPSPIKGKKTQPSEEILYEEEYVVDPVTKARKLVKTTNRNQNLKNERPKFQEDEIISPDKRDAEYEYEGNNYTTKKKKVLEKQMKKPKKYKVSNKAHNEEDEEYKDEVGDNDGKEEEEGEVEEIEEEEEAEEEGEEELEEEGEDEEENKNANESFGEIRNPKKEKKVKKSKKQTKKIKKKSPEAKIQKRKQEVQDDEDEEESEEESEREYEMKQGSRGGKSGKKIAQKKSKGHSRKESYIANNESQEEEVPSDEEEEEEVVVDESTGEKRVIKKNKKASGKGAKPKKRKRGKEEEEVEYIEEYEINPITGQKTVIRRKKQKTQKPKNYSKDVDDYEYDREKEVGRKSPEKMKKGAGKNQQLRFIASGRGHSKPQKEENDYEMIEEEYETDPKGTAKKKKSSRNSKRAVNSGNASESVEYVMDSVTGKKNMIKNSARDSQVKSEEDSEENEVQEEYVIDAQTNQMKLVRKIVKKPKKKTKSQKEIDTDEENDLVEDTDSKFMSKSSKKSSQNKSLKSTARFGKAAESRTNLDEYEEEFNDNETASVKQRKDRKLKTKSMNENSEEDDEFQETSQPQTKSAKHQKLKASSVSTKSSNPSSGLLLNSKKVAQENLYSQGHAHGQYIKYNSFCEQPQKQNQNNLIPKNERGRYMSGTTLQNNLIINPEDTFGVMDSSNTNTDKESISISKELMNSDLTKSNDKKMKSPLSIKIPYEESSTLKKKSLQKENIKESELKELKNAFDFKKNEGVYGEKDLSKMNQIIKHNQSTKIDGEMIGEANSNVYTFSNNKRNESEGNRERIGKISKYNDLLNYPKKTESNKKLVRLVSDEGEKRRRGINKHSLAYFEFLVSKYMKKRVCMDCVIKFLRYQIYKEKGYACKILYRTMKKRIIFYKIKFFHRILKIYKFLVKHRR